MYLTVCIFCAPRDPCSIEFNGGAGVSSHLLRSKTAFKTVLICYQCYEIQELAFGIKIALRRSKEDKFVGPGEMRNEFRQAPMNRQTQCVRKEQSNVMCITIKRVIHNPTERRFEMGRFAPAHKRFFYYSKSQSN